MFHGLLSSAKRTYRGGRRRASLQLAELLGQQLSAALRRRVEPLGEFVALGRVEQLQDHIELVAESRDRAGEVVAVVLEDVAPQRTVPAGDAGRVEEPLAGQRKRGVGLHRD